jgi:hypothetical protein
MFNPSPRIESVPLFDGQRCFVIDDALLEPERWIDYAAQRWHEAAIAPFNAYPGPELRMPDEISAQLDAYFAQHIRALLDARRTLRMYSRFAMVTHAPAQLEPRQWICHRDRMGVPPEQRVAASVLYLFRDPDLGGTSFFRPRRPAAEIDLLVHESGTSDRAGFSARTGIAPGYLTTSNIWFEKMATIAPRFNRMIFYDGFLFHCSDIPHPEKLDPDPRRGRLTYNGFFTCRRRAQ